MIYYPYQIFSGSSSHCEMGGDVLCMSKMIKVYKILVNKSEGMGPFGISCLKDVNIEMDHK